MSNQSRVEFSFTFAAFFIAQEKHACDLLDLPFCLVFFWIYSDEWYFPITHWWRRVCVRLLLMPSDRCVTDALLGSVERRRFRLVLAVSVPVFVCFIFLSATETVNNHTFPLVDRWKEIVVGIIESNKGQEKGRRAVPGCCSAAILCEGIHLYLSGTIPAYKVKKRPSFLLQILLWAAISAFDNWEKCSKMARGSTFLSNTQLAFLSLV